MTRVISFEEAPDLRRTYLRALLARGRRGESLPDVRAERTGIRVAGTAVARYARLCGFPVTGTMPVSYPYLLAFPLQLVVLGQPGFPLPLAGARHMQNEITATRPLSVDEPLDVTVWAEHLRPHRRGRQVELVSEVTVGGDLVWRAVSTYLTLGAEHPEAPLPQLPDRQLLAGVGAGPVRRLGAGAGRAYAAVSGDWNPIHLHPLAARPFGFPTAIAHGMYTYAVVLAALGPRLPAAGLTSRVWFRKPVRLPASIRLRSAFGPTRSLTVVESPTGEHEHALVENTWA